VKIKISTVLLLGVIFLCSCSKSDIAYEKPTVAPTERVMPTEVFIDPCINKLKTEIKTYLEGDVSNKDEIISIAESCKDHELYLRIQWGIRMKEPEILEYFLAH
jgi:hypothetical protein